MGGIAGGTQRFSEQKRNILKKIYRQSIRHRLGRFNEVKNMKKNQTNRLSKQHKKSKGPKGIFGKGAQQHDVSVRDVSINT